MIICYALPLFRTVSGLSSSEQQAMTRIIEQKQMKDFLKLYTGLVERCFESCCNDFTSKTLSTKEVSWPRCRLSRTLLTAAVRNKLTDHRPPLTATYRTPAYPTASRNSSSTRSASVHDSEKKSRCTMPVMLPLRFELDVSLTMRISFLIDEQCQDDGAAAEQVIDAESEPALYPHLS